MNTDSGTKRILCFGDSNTWGWIPGSDAQRYDAAWPETLGSILGNEYQVFSDGVGGRTILFEHPDQERSGRKGLATITASLAEHQPLDYVIVMLGTNDCKERYMIDAKGIAAGMEKLVVKIKETTAKHSDTEDQVTIVSPPIVDETTEYASPYFKGGTEKSRALASLYQDIAKKHDCLFLDAAKVVEISPRDGVHLEPEAHKKLAESIYSLMMS